MVSITLLFYLVICVTCIAKIRDIKHRRVQPQNTIPLQSPVENQRRQADENALQSEDDEEESGKTLNEEDIEKWMPIISLKDEIKKGHKIYDTSCTICLDSIDNGELLRRIKLCKHTFHAKCLMDWIHVDETCPNCKEVLSKKALLEKEKILWEKLGLNIPHKKKLAKAEQEVAEKQAPSR